METLLNICPKIAYSPGSADAKYEHSNPKSQKRYSAVGDPSISIQESAMREEKRFVESENTLAELEATQQYMGHIAHGIIKPRNDQNLPIYLEGQAGDWQANSEC